MKNFLCLVFFFMLLSGCTVHSNTLNPSLSYKKIIGPFQPGDSINGGYSLSIKVTWLLTDTGDIKYLDFESGFIYGLLLNGCPSDIRISYDYNHLWTRSYCIAQHWDSLGQVIPDDDDSLAYYCGRNSVIYNVLGFSEQPLVTLNVSNLRLFVRKDSVFNGSFATVDFKIDISEFPDEWAGGAAADSIVLKLALKDIVASDQSGSAWFSDSVASNVGMLCNRPPHERSRQNATASVYLNRSRCKTGTNLFIDKNARLPAPQGRLFTLKGSRVK